MDKADFVKLAQANARDSEVVPWTDILDFAPLPPFGALSSDMARQFMRNRAKGDKWAAENNLSSTMSKSSKLAAPKSVTNQESMSPKSTHSSQGFRHTRAFSPIAEYTAAHHPLCSNESTGVEPLFAFHPRLKNSISVGIGGRLVPPRGAKVDTPGPTVTASSYNLLSTSKQQPQYTFGVKCPQHSAVQPPVGNTDIGLPHDGFKPLGASQSVSTFGVRRVDGMTKKDHNTPVYYDWKTDEERKREMVNKDATKVKFGVRLQSIAAKDVSPGPAAYYPQPKPVIVNTDPEFDTLGRKLPIPAPVQDNPGPGQYDVNTSAKRTLHSSPAYTMVFKPKSLLGGDSDTVAASDVPLNVTFTSKLTPKQTQAIQVDNRLYGRDNPTKPRQPTFKFGTSKRGTV